MTIALSLPFATSRGKYCIPEPDASINELTRSDRLAQVARLADALHSRLIPHEDIEVKVPDSRSHPDRPRVCARS